MGKWLAGKDPIKAAEKLYKSAEECVKVPAEHLRLEEALARMREMGG